MTKELIDAIKHIRHYQHAVQSAYDQLVTKVKELATASGDQNIIAQINTRLEEAVVEEEAFRASFAALSPEDKKYVPHQVKNSKMLDIIKHLQTPEGQSYFNFLRPGSEELSLDCGSDLPKLGLESDVWGTSKTTYMVAAASYAYMTLARASLSAFSYSSPVHQKMEWGVKQHYNFIHTGYAVGGNRRLDEKEFPPHDGSSFLKEFTLPKSVEGWCNIGFSTADLFATFLAQLEGPEGHWMTSERGTAWAASADGVLPSLYHIVGDDAVRPGDIRIERKGISPENPLGTGGMSWIVIGIDMVDQFCLSANRDMPLIEGLGIEIKPSFAIPGQTIIYLRSNDAHPIDGFDYRDVINMVDAEIAGGCNFHSVFDAVE